MIEFKLAFSSVARRGLGLLPVVLPTMLLFAMVTFLVASEAAVRQLLAPTIAARTIRVGSMPGYDWHSAHFTLAEVRQFGSIEGVTPAPTSQDRCYFDKNDRDEFECVYTTRQYLEIWEHEMPVPAGEFERWDAIKTGAIISRAAAAKHHWKVGDHITLHNAENPEYNYDLEITFIADKYLNTTAVDMHYEYAAGLRKQIHNEDPVFWVVWLVVDKAERRQAVMQQIDEQLTAINRPHYMSTMENSVSGILAGSKFLRESFRLAGALSLLLAAVVSVTLLIVSISQRATQLATLLAIGFRRGVLARSILVEGVLLILPAALLGAAIMWVPFHDNPIRFDALISVKVSWAAVAITGCLSAALGIAAAIIPAWRVFRLDVISSLR